MVSLVNTGSSPVGVRLVLHADDGTALVLPLTVTQRGASQTVTSASIDQVINPHSTSVIETASQAASEGWIDVLSSGAVGGYATFRYVDSNGRASEGTVLLETQSPATLDLPYDDTGGYVVGAALANLSTGPATVTATIFDADGGLLTVQQLSLPGSGHTAFLVPERFAETAEKHGLIQFQSSGGLAGLGLRASPSFALSSVPTILP